jgi:hypothetical protein
VTLLTVAFYFFLARRVAVAHGKFNVKLPATTGNFDFERVFRVHMNTLEWMPTFLVPLWLCAIYLKRHRRRAARTCLDQRSYLVLRWLPQSRGEAPARILHPIDHVRLVVRRRAPRCRPARAEWLIGIAGDRMTADRPWTGSDQARQPRRDAERLA